MNYFDTAEPDPALEITGWWNGKYCIWRTHYLLAPRGNFGSHLQVLEYMDVWKHTSGIELKENKAKQSSKDKSENMEYVELSDDELLHNEKSTLHKKSSVRNYAERNLRRKKL